MLAKIFEDSAGLANEDVGSLMEEAWYHNPEVFVSMTLWLNSSVYSSVSKFSQPKSAPNN